MKWYVYIALKQLFPTNKFISFFAGVSILGVGLGILGLFGTQSVMNGFHWQIATKLRDTTGDIIVRANNSRPMYDLAPLTKNLEAIKGVKTIEYTSNGPVMMIINNTPSFPLLRSYDTIRAESALPIKEKSFVRMGNIDDLDDDSIIIGQYLASSLGISVGEEVEIFSPTLLDKIKKDEVPMPSRLKVVGILATGFSDVDSKVALVSLRRMQELYNLGEGTHSIIIALEAGYDCDEVIKEVRKVIEPNMLAYTWLTSNESFLRIINMEKVMMSLIIVLIIIVASFSICISLYTSVLRKTKEIGLMGAMGARGFEIALCYCIQGFIIGVLGAIFGILLTFGILHFREPIVEFIIGRQALIEFYHFASLPVRYSYSDGMWACGFAIVLCTLAGLFPAFKASRLKSSEAMRNE